MSSRVSVAIVIRDLKELKAQQEVVIINLHHDGRFLEGILEVTAPTPKQQVGRFIPHMLSKRNSPQNYFLIILPLAMLIGLILFTVPHIRSLSR